MTSPPHLTALVSDIYYFTHIFPIRRSMA